MADSLQLKHELQRKAIHIFTSVIPLAYYFGADREQILALCVFLAIGFICADILRMNFALAEKYFLAIFKKLLRGGEVDRKFTGATFLFWGMSAAVYFFPKEAAVPAVLFLTLADPMAAIVGKQFGTDKYFGKTVEGALGFYFTASAVILIMTDYSWLGLGVALISAVLEFVPVGIDDNLVVPLVSGYLLMVFS